MLSLATTMASMMQVGFGRILVVKYEQGDAMFAQEAFSMLANHSSIESTNNSALMIQNGNTEVGYVSSSKEEVASKITPIN
jgi:hypothetical protein